MIGAFSCDAGLVYDMNKHTVLNKWLLLSDPEEQAGVRGYLKVSIAILGPGDEAMVSTHANCQLLMITSHLSSRGGSVRRSVSSCHILVNHSLYLYTFVSLYVYGNVKNINASI